MNFKCLIRHQWIYDLLYVAAKEMYTIRHCPRCSEKQILNQGKWYDYDTYFDNKERSTA